MLRIGCVVVRATTLVSPSSNSMARVDYETITVTVWCLCSRAECNLLTGWSLGPRWRQWGRSFPPSTTCRRHQRHPTRDLPRDQGASSASGGREDVDLTALEDDGREESGAGSR